MIVWTLMFLYTDIHRVVPLTREKSTHSGAVRARALLLCTG